MTFGIELVGALALIAGGATLLWYAFRNTSANQRSEKIVIQTSDPKSEA